MVQQFIENAFVQLGWDPAIGADVEFDQFTRKLGILPEHHRLARADLRSLERAGVLRAVGDDHWTVLREVGAADVTAELDALEQEFPRLASEIALHRAIGLRLAEALSGDVDPMELLFPGGSSEVLEDFYVNCGDFPAYSELLPMACAAALQALPASPRIAGAGSRRRNRFAVARRVADLAR